MYTKCLLPMIVLTIMRLAHAAGDEAHPVANTLKGGQALGPGAIEMQTHRSGDLHVMPAPTTAVKNSLPPQAHERIQSKVEEKAAWANSLPSALPPLPPLAGGTSTDMSKYKSTNKTNVGATEDSATDVTNSLVAINKAKDYVEEPVGSSTSQAPSSSVAKGNLIMP